MSKEINENTMVEVWNNHRSGVSYVTDKVTRTWHTPGSMKKISLAELYDACNMPGAKKFFIEGALLIKDNEIRERLDLPALDEYTLDRKQMVALLESGNLADIEEFLQYCSNMLLNTFVQVAIELPLSNMSVAHLIGKYVGLDLVNVIAEKVAEQPEIKSASTNKARPQRLKKE